MADMQQLYTALRNADAAGDVEGAKRLADYIKSQQVEPQAEKPQSLADKAIGAGEAALSTLSGATTGAIGGALSGANQLVQNVMHGDYGTQKGHQAVENAFMHGMELGTYAPRTKAGQQIMSDVVAPIAEQLAPVPLLGAESEAILAASRPAINRARVEAARAGNVVDKALSPIAESVRAKVEGAKPKPEVPAEVTPRTQAMSMGADQANPNPWPVLTGEETVRGQYPVVKVSKIAQDVPEGDQVARANIHNEVMREGLGEEPTTMRTGVLTGNEDTLRSEHLAAKTGDNELAQEMKAQIANEQNALHGYAEKRVEATGASPTLLNDEQRGELINSALIGSKEHGEGLVGWLAQVKNAGYEAARKAAGDNPIPTTHINDLLNDEQFRAGLGLTGNEGVGKSAEKLIEMASTVGFKDRSGNVYAPNTVGAWDAVRKALNANWTPQNAHIIRELNGAIDKDISAAGGAGLFKQMDAIHKAEKTLFDSKGIRDIFGAIDPNGVKSEGVALDKIISRLNNMSPDQWKHIYDVADDLSKGKIRGAPEGMPNIPEELRKAGEAVTAEMRGALARKVQEAGAGKIGVWNQNDVNKVLNSNIGSKIAHSFSPEEQAKMHTLNMAGQIMPGVHSYEGAALQANRLEKLPGLVEKHAEKAGVAIGAGSGALLHPLLSTATGVGGKALGAKLAQRLHNKRMVESAKETKKKMAANVAKAKKKTVNKE